MRFWRVLSPQYDSDYRQSYINGSIGHPHTLRFPSVECDVCCRTLGASWKLLPYECPASLRGVIELLSDSSLPRDEHRALQVEVFNALGLKGEPFVDIEPGAHFQPCCLDIPSRPRADFLWPFSNGFLVSQRIRDLLINLCGNEIGASQVVLRKVGRREAKLPTPIPQSGEPEDIINEAPLLSDATGVGPYYHIVPRHESIYPPSRVPKSICPGCQHVDLEYQKQKVRLFMTDAMWRGHKIFHMGSTLWIIITDEIKQALERLHPTNVTFTEAN